MKRTIIAVLIALTALTGATATASAAPRVANESPQEIINGFFQGIECGLNQKNPMFKGNPECPRRVLVYSRSGLTRTECVRLGKYLVKRYRNADSYTCSYYTGGGDRKRLKVYDHKW